jgi:hypothetical protein
MMSSQRRHLVKVLRTSRTERLFCLAFHWQPRSRDSYGGKCRTCGLYW